MLNVNKITLGKAVLLPTLLVLNASSRIPVKNIGQVITTANHRIKQSIKAEETLQLTSLSVTV